MRRRCGFGYKNTPVTTPNVPLDSTPVTDAMVLYVNTALSENNTVSLPLRGATDCTIYWGDKSSTTVVNENQETDVTHTYVIPFTYTISITGTLSTFGKGEAWDGVTGLLSCSTFGTTQVTALPGAFMGAVNLTTLPAENIFVTDISNALSGATVYDGTAPASWNITNLTDASNMLDNCGISFTNYAAILAAWADKVATESGPYGITVGASGLKYVWGNQNRDFLINDALWEITGDLGIEYSTTRFTNDLVESGFISDTCIIDDIGSADGKSLSVGAWYKPWEPDTGPGGSSTLMHIVSANTNAGTSWWIGGYTKTGVLDWGFRVVVTGHGTYGPGLIKEYYYGPIDPTVWNHVGFTWDAGTLKLFLNGAEVTPTKVHDVEFDTFYTTGYKEIGIATRPSCMTCINAEIALPFIYHKVLSPAEMLETKDAILPVVSSPAAWLLENKDTYLEDVSGNERHGVFGTGEAKPYHTGKYRILEPGQFHIGVTVNATNGMTVDLPFYGDLDLVIDWGDSNIEPVEILGNDTNIEHTYSVTGNYEIKVKGFADEYAMGGETYQNVYTHAYNMGELGITELGWFWGDSWPNLKTLFRNVSYSLTDISWRFCELPQDIDVDYAGWDVSNVDNMGGFAYGNKCVMHGMENFRFKDDADISEVFEEANVAASELNWDISRTSYISGLFSYTQFKSALNADNWVLPPNSIDGWFFDACNTDYPVSMKNWILPDDSENDYCFYGCSFNCDFDTSGWKTGSNSTVSYMFDASNIENMHIGEWVIDPTTDYTDMLSGIMTPLEACNRFIIQWAIQAKERNITGINLGSASGLIYDSVPLTEFIGEDFDNGKAAFEYLTTELSWTIDDAVEIEVIDENTDISGWDMSGSTPLSTYLANKHIIGDPGIGVLDVSNFTSLNGMFENSTIDTSLNLNTWDVTGITSATDILKNAHLNESLVFDNWVLSSLTNASSMLRYAKINVPITITTSMMPAISILSNFLQQATIGQNVKVDLSGLNVDDVSSFNYLTDELTIRNGGELDIHGWKLGVNTTATVYDMLYIKNVNGTLNATDITIASNCNTTHLIGPKTVSGEIDHNNIKFQNWHFENNPSFAGFIFGDSNFIVYKEHGYYTWTFETGCNLERLFYYGSFRTPFDLNQMALENISSFSMFFRDAHYMDNIIGIDDIDLSATHLVSKGLYLFLPQYQVFMSPEYYAAVLVSFANQAAAKGITGIDMGHYSLKYITGPLAKYAGQTFDNAVDAKEYLLKPVIDGGAGWTLTDGGPVT